MLQRERDDLLDTTRRLQADFENYRKRVLREQTALVERATEGSLEQLLPVLDSFELAVTNLDGSDVDEKVRKGIELVFAELIAVLERAGLEQIDALGAPFDPNEHEAVLQDDGDGEPHVGGVLRTGWKLKGRVLRPAMVKVTRIRGRNAVAAQREWFEKDYYAVLGVPQGSTDKEISRAYKKLAKQYHPDANPATRQAEETLQGDLRRVRRARRRRRSARSTTRFGAWLRRASVPVASAVSGPAARAVGRSTSTAALGDLGGLFGNLFGGGGGASGARHGPQRGQDLETELHLSFDDAVHGVTSTVRFRADATCSTCAVRARRRVRCRRRVPQCHGSGSIAVDQGPFSFSQVCPTCGGRGQVIPNRAHVRRARNWRRNSGIPWIKTPPA